MRIAVIGPVAVPAAAGGMTRHSEEVYARLAARGADVTLYTRRARTQVAQGHHRGMRVVALRAPRSRGWETLVYGASASIRALLGPFDVVHYQGVAAGLFCWIQRLRPGRKLVFTHHREDWLDEKWGPSARRLLRLTAHVSLRTAHTVISVSNDLADRLRDIYNRSVEVVPNGVTLHADGGGESLAALGLRPRGYVLTVGRIVPEKQVHMVVEAFERVQDESLVLAVVGEPRHSEEYAAKLRDHASPRVRFLGFQTGENLGALYAHAAAFVTASRREGMPLALLEAMGSSLPVVASDIPVHREVLDGCGLLFGIEDEDALVKGIEAAVGDSELGARARDTIVKQGYEWDQVADRTWNLINS
jgi:glycosyltransferase involved in cell wall biosynthesis